MPLKTDLQQLSDLLDDKLKPIQKQLEEHGHMLKNHEKLLRSLKKDQNIMLKLLDKEQMEQRKRIIRIEKHLNIPSVS